MNSNISNSIVGLTSSAMAVITPAMQQIDYIVRVAGGVAFLIVSVISCINLIRNFYKGK
jgi:hypothetical protein